MMLPPVVRARAVVLLLLMAACASQVKFAKWPHRGAMIQATNPTSERVVILARDGVGREWKVATIAPWGRTSFRWPFVDARGWLMWEGTNTNKGQSRAFEPWAADLWSWSVGDSLPQVVRK